MNEPICEPKDKRRHHISQEAIDFHYDTGNIHDLDEVLCEEDDEGVDHDHK